MEDLTLPKFLKVKDKASGKEMYCPININQRKFKSALKYKAEDTDVFVCSYPKTGTTWLMNIVWLILHDGTEVPGPYRESIPMLEFDGSEAPESIRNREFPCIIKTHFPYKFVQINPKAKYLYITRNPKDAFVSFYFHIRGCGKKYGTENPDINKLYDQYMKGEVQFDCYFDHLNEWYSHRNDSNVLFLLYEDMKQDPRNGILKVAKFLGEKYEELLMKENGKLMEKVLELSSFEHMKSRTIWEYPKRPANEPFIRKGVIGDWKNHLSAEQADGLDRALMEHGKESGISKLWDKYAEFL
ncbi:amine sulfotransferase-like [Ciona intestinalis]